jgi:transcription-repair coupling factor (superfamily II helicase)
MDRLVCGDIGFGKTEVVLRVLFHAVINGCQAALLAPTGVLLAQHYKNFMNQMGPNTEFNFNITLFWGRMGKNMKAGQEICDQIEEGKINLIIRTHALLP